MYVDWRPGEEAQGGVRVHRAIDNAGMRYRVRRKGLHVVPVQLLPYCSEQWFSKALNKAWLGAKRIGRDRRG